MEGKNTHNPPKLHKDPQVHQDPLERPVTGASQALPALMVNQEWLEWPVPQERLDKGVSVQLEPPVVWD